MPSEFGEQSDESDRKDDHDSQVPKLILSGANLKSSAKIDGSHMLVRDHLMANTEQTRVDLLSILTLIH